MFILLCVFITEKYLKETYLGFDERSVTWQVNTSVVPSSLADQAEYSCTDLN